MPRDSFLRKTSSGYFVMWLPMSALIVALLIAQTELQWLAVLACSVPMCAVLAVLSRSSWYISKSIPLSVAAFTRILLIHSCAAVITAGLWTGLWVGLARLLPSSLGQYVTAIPWLLWGVGSLCYLISAGFHYVVLTLARSRSAERRAERSATLAREAELAALRAQLNPHFLFNSLNSIAALIRVDAPSAGEMCLNLSEFLRETMRLGAQARIPLSQELDLVRMYLKIEQKRFGERLRLEESLDPACLNVHLPPLLLQPLVENAIKHGVAAMTTDGQVAIRATRAGGEVVISIENAYDSADAGSRHGAGRGAAIVRERLVAFYGRRASLRNEKEDNRFRVELRLPC